MIYFVILLVLIGSVGLVIPNTYAMCIENDDWPQAPCHDSFVNDNYDQDEVDRWSEYYSYKGSQFMEEKKAEMQATIDDKRLHEWVGKSNQNENVWHYYYFSGRAPNAYSFSANFEIINVFENKEFDFKIWPKQSVLSRGSEIILNGNLCPSLYDNFKLEPFYHEESFEEMNKDGFLVMHYLEKPDGTVESQMGNYYQYDCSEPIRQNFHADQLGDYTVYAEATWKSDVIKKITSNTVTIIATTPLFDYVVEPIIVNNENWVLHEPLDWSPDGNSILFRVWVEPDSEQRLTSLVLIGPDGIIQKELQIIGSAITGVDHAQISPTNDMIHILDNGKIYRYVLETDEIVLLNIEENNAQFFDYYSYDEDDVSRFSIVYSVDNLESTDDPSSQFTLLITDDDLDSGSIYTPSEYFGQLESPVFQFSPNGYKILFVKTIDAGYGWADRVPAYIEAQDYGPHIITNVDLNCGNNLKWSPNGEMVVYQDQRCGRTVDSGFMGLVTLDGYNEKLIPQTDPSTSSYPRSFVIEPDGSTIVYVTGSGKSDFGESGDFYKITLTKPIPEFEAIAFVILTVSLIPIILARDKFHLR